MSASQWVTRQSCWLTNIELLGRGKVQRRFENLVLFFLLWRTVSRLGSGVFKDNITSFEVPHLSLSWSLAEGMSSYLSKIICFVEWGEYTLRRSAQLEAMSSIVPSTGHTTLYNSCPASTMMWSGSAAVGRKTLKQLYNYCFDPFPRQPILINERWRD